MTDPNILLLTHEREVSKPTNTAQCAINVLSTRVQKILWQRTEPNSKLMAILKSERVGLVYPDYEGSAERVTVGICEHWLILDGTWQEARKMFNRSRYLHNLPRIQITPTQPSQYQLRRNQKPDGLSTAECIAQLLKENGETDLCDQILAEFNQFNRR
jgi:DTW domain-containing protein YfiP